MYNTANQNNPSDVAGQSREASNLEFSRRNFVRLLMLAGMSLAIPPQIGNSSQQTQNPHKEIERVAGLFNKLQTEEATLPGFRNLGKWASNTFPKKFSPQDADLLQGALYLKALNLLEGNQRQKTPAPTLESVRRVMTNAKPMSCFATSDINSLLEATKLRARKEPDFARKVMEAKDASQRIGCKGGGGGDIPGWLCGIIIIIIIIIIIL